MNTCMLCHQYSKVVFVSEAKDLVEKLKGPGRGRSCPFQNRRVRLIATHMRIGINLVLQLIILNDL